MHKICTCNIFMLMYNDAVYRKPQHSTEFFSFIDQSYSFNSRQIDRQISPALIILKLSYFGKNGSFGSICEKWKFCELWLVGSRNWFVIHNYLILTLHSLLRFLYSSKLNNDSRSHGSTFSCDLRRTQFLLDPTKQ